MKRTRQRYDRAFKISVVAELESGKSPSQIAREHSIHPSLGCSPHHHNSEAKLSAT
jgi:transposase